MKTSKVWTGLIATAALFLASAICAQEPNTAASAPQATAPYSAEAKQGPSPAPRLSRGITDLLKMQERGIDKSVMRSYIESSPVAYQPTVEEIIHQHQQGLPDDLTTLLIHHGAQLRAQSPVPAQNQASIGADSTPVAAPVQPQQPIVVSTPAPVYNVPSTTYFYSDPYPVYGPSVSLDFGFWGSPYWRSYPYYRSYGFHGGSYVSHGWSGGYHGGSYHGGYSGHSYGGGGHFGGGSHSGGGGGHHR